MLRRAKQVFFANYIDTTFGAVLGTFTVTTYVESVDSIAEEGKTRMSSLTVAGMFFLALFFVLVFTMILSAATAHELIIVGLFMMSPVLKINFNDNEFIPDLSLHYHYALQYCRRN